MIDEGGHPWHVAGFSYTKHLSGHFSFLSYLTLLSGSTLTNRCHNSTGPNCYPLHIWSFFFLPILTQTTSTGYLTWLMFFIYQLTPKKSFLTKEMKMNRLCQGLNFWLASILPISLPKKHLPTHTLYEHVQLHKDI